MKHLYILITTLFSLGVSAQTRTVGTLLHNAAEAYDGYTLLSPLHSSNNKTYLIDNCGDTVHSWSASLSAGLTATLLPNGDLLRPAIEPTATVVAGGSGGRVQVFDWNSNMIWDYLVSSQTENAHHEVVPMPNGNFLVLMWSVKDSLECVTNGRNPSTIPDKLVWSEKIIEVEPTGPTTGNIVWEWDIWDHIIQDFDSTRQNFGVVANHPELLDVNYLGWSAGGKDWLHANAINYNAQLDQIVMSCRYTHEIYVIDHSTTTAEAAGHTGGLRGKGGDILFRWGNPAVYRKGTPADQKLYAQHNSAWIPPGLTDAGKIMIFNNGNTRPGGDFSSIDIINPLMDSAGNYRMTMDGKFLIDSTFWSYTAPQPTDFFSAYISGAQRLPNGNTLICSGTWGHLFEITPSGEKVWEYLSPVTTSGVLSQGSTPASNPVHGTFNWVFRANKYPLNYPAFTNKTLTPGDPVEQDPLPSICDIAITVQESGAAVVKVFPNPATNNLMIEGAAGSIVKIYSVTGSLVLQSSIIDQKQIIDISMLQPGMYIASIGTANVKIQVN